MCRITLPCCEQGAQKNRRIALAIAVAMTVGRGAAPDTTKEMIVLKAWRHEYHQICGFSALNGFGVAGMIRL